MNQEETKKMEKAVALVYDETKASAPRVIASGAGKIAEKIIEAAKAAGIHIQQDPNLVELLAKVPIGDEIPVELYTTVAEVLAFVYRINNRFKHKLEQSPSRF